MLAIMSCLASACLNEATGISTYDGLANAFSDTIVAEEIEPSDVVGLKVEITGHIENGGILIINNGEEITNHTFNLKGDVSEVLEGDWYTNQMFIRYTPIGEGSNEDKISLAYDFNTM